MGVLGPIAKKVAKKVAEKVDEKLRQWDDVRKEWQVRAICFIVEFVFLRRGRSQGISAVFDPNRVKRVLFLRHDNKIGDMIVSTVIYRNLKVCRPDLEIHVVTGDEGAQVLQENKYIYKIWIARRGLFNFWQLGRKLKQEKIEVVIDFSRSLHPAVALLFGVAQIPHRIGYTDQPVGLLTKRVSDQFANKHMTQKYLSAVKIFGCESQTLSYDFPLNPDCVHQVDESFQRVNLGKYLVFNAFAGGKGRVLSDDKIIEIVRMISAQLAFHKLTLVFVAPAEHMIRVQHLARYCLDRLNIETHVFPRLTHLHHLGRIIQSAQVVISPDTSVIHMASAFQTPLVALFRKDWPEGEQNCEVWAPQGTKFVRAFAREPSYLGEEVSINEISAMDVSGSLSVLLQMIKHK